MKRREFIATLGSGFAASALVGKSLAAHSSESVVKVSSGAKSRMHLGTQKRPPDGNMQYFKRHGVNHICGYPEKWTKKGFSDLKQRCESNGIVLEMIPTDVTRSVGLIGDQQTRDRQIDRMIAEIQAAGEVGIPCIKYNITILNVLRTDPTPGRGGSSYLSWNYEKAPKGLPLTEAGEFPVELFWERIEHFLKRVVPVAEQCRVRLACHPHDPGVPQRGYRGVQRVLGSVDGLKKFVDIEENPYHGLNYCVGSVAEMLENPPAEILESIRYFGERKKLFNIHLRNIRGRRNRFQEVYLDEGDLNIFAIVRLLKEVGYDGMVMPDHVPEHPDDPNELQGFAFSYGYIQAMIQAVYAESSPI